MVKSAKAKRHMLKSDKVRILPKQSRNIDRNRQFVMIALSPPSLLVDNKSR